MESRRHRPDLRLDGATSHQYGVAHQHGGAAGRGLLVVRHDRSVTHDDGDRVERRTELLGGDLGEDRPGALAHVRRTGQHDDASVGEQTDGRIRESCGRSGLDAYRDAASVTRDERLVPSDQVGGSAHRLVPVAVGGRVERDERVALARQVAQSNLESIDAESAGSLIQVRLDRPVDLRVAEAAERRGRQGVRQDAAREDPYRGNVVRPGGGIAPLSDNSVGDIRVRADEVVRLDVLEGNLAVRREAGSDADLARCSARGLE